VFEDFEVNYAMNPRKEAERFKKYTKEDIENRDYNLDIFWLNDKSFIDYNELSDPLDLASEMVQQLETALDSVNELVVKLRKS